METHVACQMFLQICLLLSLSQAEFVGEDVKIKFVFDPFEDYQEWTNNSSVSDFPFSTNLRNISFTSYYDNAGKQENIESTSKPDRRDQKPGRALDIGKPDSKSVLGESFPGLDLSKFAPAKSRKGGERCVDKVIMEEITEYKEEIRCEHSYDTQCHTSYVTTYTSQQVQECQENFVKTCFIEYEKRAIQDRREICRRPLVRNCNSSGPEICRTIYQSECWTKQEKHEVEDDVASCQSETETSCSETTTGYATSKECKGWPRQVCKVVKTPVTKYTPITGCNKEPVEICAPAGCGYEEGPEECHDKTITIIQDVPKEMCDLEPRNTCQFVTKLVPRLEPSEECVDVPKEICARGRGSPVKVQRPTVKRWCYSASKESGQE